MTHGSPRHGAVFEGVRGPRRTSPANTGPPGRRHRSCGGLALGLERLVERVHVHAVIPRELAEVALEILVGAQVGRRLAGEGGLEVEAGERRDRRFEAVPL